MSESYGLYDCRLGGVDDGCRKEVDLKVLFRMWRLNALVMPRPSCCIVCNCGVGDVCEYP